MSEAQGPNTVAPIESQPNAGITTYVDDTVGSVSTTVARTTLLSSLVGLGSVPGVASIQDYLKRPTRLASGSLTATDTTALFDVDPWVLQLTGVKSQKVSGIGMMRADIVIRLEVNAVRFQAGRYILAWLPSGGVNSNGFAYLKRMKYCSLTTLTQLPHVEIDLAKETHVTLNIPFTANKTYMPLSTTGALYGSLVLYPYVALIPGSGDTTCPYTVWASFENIELTAPAIPQMSFSVKTPQRKEQEEAKIGPISGFAAKVSKTASIFGQIPVLSAAMTGVSWISGIVGNAAKVWGFSRPVVLSPPTRVVTSMFPYMANSDQPTIAQPLALIAENEVVIHSGVSPTSLDEMTIDFIKKQYAYTARYNWSTAQAADTVLAFFNHRPHDYYTGIGNAVARTPVCFVANEFRYWRGSMTFRFKLVKTEFHSGRLLMSYSPYLTTATPTWNLNNTEYTYRQIIDIRDVAEFEVTIPFVQSQPWVKGDALPGVLEMIVLDPLVAPSSVSSTVPILIEVCGGDDMEFAWPYSDDAQPVAPAVAMSSFSISAPDVYATAPPATLGSTSGSSIEASAVTIGEKVTSLRQLLKRTVMIEATAGDYTIVASVLPTSSAFIALPYRVSIVTQATSNVSPYSRDITLPDFFSKYSACFLFSSGGVNLRAFDPEASVNASMWVDLYDIPSSAPSSVVSATTPVPPSSSTRMIALNSVVPYVDVMVPNYYDRVARVNHAQFSSLAFSSSYAQGAQALAVRVSPTTPTAINWFVARPVADDFNLSHWIGVPPLVLPGTT